MATFRFLSLLFVTSTLATAAAAAAAFQSTNPNTFSVNLSTRGRGRGLAASAQKQRLTQKLTIHTTASTSLYASTRSSNNNEQSNPELDAGALVKYGSAIAVQMSCITALFYGLDAAVDTTGITLPFPAVAALFFLLSIKSRIFNPLNNKRPDQDLQKLDRILPSWQPPGILFPIMWVLIVGPIRAYSSTLVYYQGVSIVDHSYFANPAILALMLHLSIGDVWNTINNTEKRYGAAVPGVLSVSAAATFAATQYYQVDPLAGKLLGGTLLWFAVASTLIADTWRLNPDPLTGERDPLYPTLVKGEDSLTEFAWFKTSIRDE